MATKEDPNILKLKQMEKDLEDIKETIVLLAAECDFDISQKSHAKGTTTEIQQFEGVVAALQAMCLEDFIPAHLQLGYLYERGLVSDVSKVSGNYLSVIGAFYHYSEAIRLSEESGKAFENINLSQIISEFQKKETADYKDINKIWRLKPGAPSDYLFNQAVDCEIKSNDTDNVMKKRYLLGWAQYLYERAGGVYGNGSEESTSVLCQSRALYNMGIMYKLGKGIISPELNTMFEKMPMIVVALDCFEYSMHGNYGPAYYEFYKLTRKGIVKEYIDREQMLVVYEKAAGYLERAIEQNHGPAFKRKAEMLLYGQHEDLADRKPKLQNAFDLFKSAINWYSNNGLSDKSALTNFEQNSTKSFLEDPNIIKNPWYHIIAYKLANFIRQRLFGPVLEVCVFVSLKGFAIEKKLPFAATKAKTQEKIKTFVQLILTNSGIQIIEAVSDNPVKNQNPNIDISDHAKRTVSQNVKVFLYEEGKEWEKVDLSLWITQFNKFVKENIVVPSFVAFKKFDLNAEFKGKLDELPIPFNTNKSDPDRKFDIALNMCSKQIDLYTKIAKKVFPLISPNLRSLKEQIQYFDIGSRLLEAGEPFFNDVTIDMARLLLLKCHFVEEGTQDQSNQSLYQEKIIKHCDSVIAIVQYAMSKKLSLREAREEIDEIMQHFLLNQKAQKIDIAYLGYNRAVSIIAMQNLRTSTFASNIFSLVAEKRERRIHAVDYLKFDNTWLSPDSAAVKWISPDNGIADCSLKALFERGKNVIQKMMIQAGEIGLKEARLNLKSITYEDPYTYLFAQDIDDYFTDFNATVTEELRKMEKGLIDALAEEGDPVTFIFREKLEQAYQKITGEIINVLPKDAKIDSESIKNAFKKIYGLFSDGNEENTWRMVYFKKFFIFYLNVCLKSGTPENMIVSLEQLILGLSERCQDGKYSYFNDWFIEYSKANSEEIKKLSTFGPVATKNLELRIRISRLLLELKKDYINRHLSRSKTEDHVELILSTKVLIYQMLMQFLSIPGYYTQLKYGGAFMGDLANPLETLKMESMVERFFKGGKVKYVGPDHENILRGMTLSRIVDLIRKSIFKNEGPEVDQFSAISEDKDDSEELRPYEKIYTKIPYKLIAEYIDSDIEMSIDYKNLVDSNFSRPTKYFKAEAQHFGVNLADCAIVKMLHEFGYVECGKDFFNNVDSKWKAP